VVSADSTLTHNAVRRDARSQLDLTALCHHLRRRTIRSPMKAAAPAWARCDSIKSGCGACVRRVSGSVLNGLAASMKAHSNTRWWGGRFAFRRQAIRNPSVAAPLRLCAYRRIVDNRLHG
jgi:hypothetical protein